MHCSILQFKNCFANCSEVPCFMLCAVRVLSGLVILAGSRPEELSLVRNESCIAGNIVRTIHFYLKSFSYKSQFNSRDILTDFGLDLLQPRPQLVILIFQHFLLNSNRLNKLNGSFQILHLEISRVSNWVFLASDPWSIWKLFVRKAKLLFGPTYLLNQLAFIVCLLRNDLSSQILNLCSQSQLNCLSFNPHDVTPNIV
jgi:hypothetical protein